MATHNLPVDLTEARRIADRIAPLAAAGVDDLARLAVAADVSVALLESLVDALPDEFDAAAQRAEVDGRVLRPLTLAARLELLRKVHKMIADAVDPAELGALSRVVERIGELPPVQKEDDPCPVHIVINGVLIGGGGVADLPPAVGVDRD